jgi:hypothetical protein
LPLSVGTSSLLLIRFQPASRNRATRDEEVGTVEKNVTTYACSPSLAAAHSTVAGTWTAYDRSVLMVGVVVPAPLASSVEGTGLSISMRDKTAIATNDSQATSTLPISNVVVFGDNAGIRTWSPPV